MLQLYLLLLCEYTNATYRSIKLNNTAEQLFVWMYEITFICSILVNLDACLSVKLDESL